MRKIAFSVLMVMAVIVANAQSSVVVSAFNYLKYGKLDKAKEAIDKAILNPKTMEEPKTWYYYGNIYLSIQLTEDEKYKALDPDALEKAYDGYQKALKLDTDKEYTNDINDRILVCAEQFYNKGVNKYNEEKYAEAVKSFDKSAGINSSIGKIDSLATFNAALCAELSGNPKDAKTKYIQLIEWNYHQPAIYSSLSEIFKAEGDTATALSYLQMGRKKYPENFNLIIGETNIYLAAGEKDKALELLKLALTQDDKNPTIFFAVGTNYDQMGNFEEAEKAYLQAISLKADYFDANYNLGALYVNKAIEIMDKANALPLNEEKQYVAMKTDADALLVKSLPYLERADELQPNDQYTMRTLKDIYTRLGMVDKLKSINEKLEK
jgi:tetratricopeptide (TPR) repeat protein